MKQLYDLSPFRWNPLPPPNHYHEMEFYHHRSRRFYRMRNLSPGVREDQLRIECDGACERDPACHAAGNLARHQSGCIAQSDSVELHQYQIVDQFFG